MATNNTDLNAEWNISTDIYDIARSINSLKQRYIDNKDETTLSLGIFGFISDVLSKEIQTDTIMTGIYGNEMFPTRAQLTKNVLTHAIYNSITDINAIASKITVNLGLKVEDFNRYAIFKDNRYEFVFDHMCALFIGEYEFHLDYDIILTKSATKDVYSARYDMSKINRISTINQPYLNQPFVIKIGIYEYIVFQATLQQLTITEINDRIISNSVVDNKTYTFSFPDQLIDFDVYINDNGNVTRLIPLLNGTISTDLANPYCWYLFMSDNSIRISFDTKSFIPGANSDIYIKIYTTLGKSGEFTYSKIDQYSEGFFVELTSTYLGYSNITCYLIADTDSAGGHDRKTKEELQSLIPKAAISRGSITTETDVANYFNLIDNPDNRLVMRKKIDNNIARVWYCFMLLKDELNNIIPTNCVPIRLNIDPLSPDCHMIPCHDDYDRKVLPAGMVFRYNPTYGFAEIIDESEIPGDAYSRDYYSDGCYYYRNIHNIIVNPDPLYAAFYLTTIKQQGYFTCSYVNDDCQLQFVANKFNFESPLLSNGSAANTYTLSFRIAQSIEDEFGLYNIESVISTDPDTGEQSNDDNRTLNMKCIVVFYYKGDNTPYRWTECAIDPDNSEPDSRIYAWKKVLNTDYRLDDANELYIESKQIDEYDGATQHRILPIYENGSPASDDPEHFSYGFFGPIMQTKVYILAKFEDGEFGRYDLDNIAPGFDGYTVTNVYDITNGLTFFENYTGITNCRIKHVGAPSSNVVEISNIPMVGWHYLSDETAVKYFFDVLESKRRYIMYCIELLENNMDIDFKFFNTYGDSKTYSMGDRDETLIGHIDLNMRFRVSLINSSDIYTKDDIINTIKNYMEDIYVIGNWHAPNMISTLMNDYQFNTRCNFIEFMNYNDNRLGIQHIIEKDVEDPHVIPEFLNIRNVLNDDGEIVPDIDVEIVND